MDGDKPPPVAWARSYETHWRLLLVWLGGLIAFFASFVTAACTKPHHLEIYIVRRLTVLLRFLATVLILLKLPLLFIASCLPMPFLDFTASASTGHSWNFGMGRPCF